MTDSLLSRLSRHIPSTRADYVVPPKPVQPEVWEHGILEAIEPTRVLEAGTGNQIWGKTLRIQSYWEYDWAPRASVLILGDLDAEVGDEVKVYVKRSGSFDHVLHFNAERTATADVVAERKAELALALARERQS
jgi:hypothetical protein